ncbi:MAG: hypothetical protein M0Q92_01300 [Methanoregula sp.]|jgi:hypothetical protein|nr:hypothetical protein [Methanoregula sp.]
MMRRNHVLIVVMASILILCLLVTAGCTTIPGPELRQTPTPEKTTDPGPLNVQTLAKKTMTSLSPTPLPTVQSPAQPTVQSAISSTPAGTYELRTCDGLGGMIVTPGEMCPGTWLDAANTFSCCSLMPVSAIDRNDTISIEPLDLVIIMDDNPGTVLP